MEAAARRAGSAWVECLPDAALQLSGWQHQLSHRGIPSGRIVLRVDSPMEAARVRELLIDSVVNLGGVGTLLEVEVISGSQGNGAAGHRVPARG